MRHQMYNWADHNNKRLEEVSGKMGVRTKPNVLWLKENADDTVLRLCDNNLRNGIPTLSATLNDFELGIACFAGYPNVGKSSLLNNMITQSLELNHDLDIIDFTFDDPFSKKYQQYIASMTGLAYQQITTKTADYDKIKPVVDLAREKLSSWYTNGRLKTIENAEWVESVVGGSKMVSFRKPENLFNVIRSARDDSPDRKLAIFVDAWNNVDYSGGAGGSDITKENYWLAELDATAKANNAMVILSNHIRKGASENPDFEDMKGSSDMSYLASFIAILRNEKREGRTDALMFSENGNEYPILRADITRGKNKCSSWDMDLMWKLSSIRCGIKPLDIEEYSTYQSQLAARKK